MTPAYDERFMRMALDRAAGDPHEVPVGAVIVREGRVLAAAHNRREGWPPDPLGHAELLAIRQAAEALGTRRLTGCAIYVTLEPCPMCAGAILQAGLSACYYAAPDPERGCCGSVYSLTQDPAFTHRTPAAGGFLRAEAEAQLQRFFSARRAGGQKERHSMETHETSTGLRCWAEVDLDRLTANLRAYRAALNPGTEIIAVVKADAYGHGDVPVERALYGEGVRRFAVATVEEGIRLRETLPDAECVILGYTPPQRADALSEYRLTQTLVDAAYAEALREQAHGEVDCVYAIDTGMRRIGLDAEDLPAAEAAIRSVRAPLRLRGLMTHLCVADAPADDASARFTALQLARFDALAERVRDLSLNSIHCLNSAGGLYAGAHGPVRLGIVLYGLKPDASNTLPAGILPVMSWKCLVAQVKTVCTGETVGYGRTWAADSDRRIATLTVGYADGYPRILSNRGYVLIRGVRVPIVGRVCMDQMMVDVTDCPGVTPGDTAVLCGEDGGETLSADQLAEMAGTIGYEMVCGISARVPRIYSGRSFNT